MRWVIRYLCGYCVFTVRRYLLTFQTADTSIESGVEVSECHTWRFEFFHIKNIFGADLQNLVMVHQSQVQHR